MLLTKTEMQLDETKKQEVIARDGKIVSTTKGIEVYQTGVVDKWVLVHDGTKVIINQENVKQETISLQKTETFDTEKEMTDRIAELNLVVPEKEAHE